jgi:hypothetical protein
MVSNPKRVEINVFVDFRPDFVAWHRKSIFRRTRNVVRTALGCGIISADSFGYISAVTPARPCERLGAVRKKSREIYLEMSVFTVSKRMGFGIPYPNLTAQP